MTSWTKRPIGSFSPRMQIAVVLFVIAAALVEGAAVAIVASALVNHLPSDWRFPAFLVMYIAIMVSRCVEKFR